MFMAPPARSVLRVLALGVRLGSLLALLLRHLLVLLRALLCGCLAFLRRALAAHRGVAHHVAGGLLAAAEELVEKSHGDPLPAGYDLPSTRSICQVHKKRQSRRTRRFIGFGWRSICLRYGVSQEAA